MIVIHIRWPLRPGAYMERPLEGGNAHQTMIDVVGSRLYTMLNTERIHTSGAGGLTRSISNGDGLRASVL